MIQRLRRWRALASVAAYAFAVCAVLGASALGAHAARLVTVGPQLCLNGDADGASDPAHALCGDLCRIAGAPALAALAAPEAAPSRIVAIVATADAEAAPAASLTVAPVARGPPAAA